MDPRPKILADIDIESSKIYFSSNPIVLLCGGFVPEKDGADAPELPVASLRDAVSRKFPPYEIFRPEEIKSWQNDGVFKNLMDFESDLASICSLVVIILESEGAIAELGAFSQLKDLSKKLIVIVSDEHADRLSFINLGILRYITRDHETGVKRYPWIVREPINIPDHVVDDVIDDIKIELDGLKKSQTLSSESDVHLVVLICELVRMFVALKESELIEWLAVFGRAVHRDLLRRKLFLLEQFRIVQRITYSDSVFYASKDDGFHRIKFSFKSKAPLDYLRVQLECREYYDSQRAERNRVRAIQQARLGGGK